MRALVIDPSAHLAQEMSQILAGEGFFCSTPGQMRQAREQACDPQNNYHIIFAQMRLPNLEAGLSLLKDIRAHGVISPIFAYSCERDKNSVEAIEIRIQALKNGADECQHTPIDYKEALHRTWSLMGRDRTSWSCKPDIFYLGPLKYTPQEGTISYQIPAGTKVGQEMHFKFSQQRAVVLGALFESPGKTVSKEHLLRRLYPNEVDQAQERILTVIVSKVREQLKEAARNEGDLDFDPLDILKVEKNKGYYVLASLQESCQERSGRPLMQACSSLYNDQAFFWQPAPSISPVLNGPKRLNTIREKELFLQCGE